MLILILVFLAFECLLLSTYMLEEYVMEAKSQLAHFWFKYNNFFFTKHTKVLGSKFVYMYTIKPLLAPPSIETGGVCLIYDI